MKTIRTTAVSAALTAAIGLLAMHSGTLHARGAAPGARVPRGTQLTANTLTWLEQEVAANDGQIGDEFGYSVAVSGDTAFVGARFGGSTPNSGGSGLVYVFTKVNGVWTQTQELTGSDSKPFDDFGQSVAVDGNTAVVGSIFATDTYQGAAYVFTKSGGTWTQTAEITASDGASNDFFGSAVSIDGSTIAVGAARAAVGGNAQQGAVYVFSESGGTWSQDAKLTAADGAAYDQLGFSVSLSGSTVISGAPYAVIGGASAQGAAYVYSDSGGTWSQVQKLVASDGAQNNYFGYAIGLQGTTALITSPFAMVKGNVDQGKTYVFDESGGTWSQVQELEASDGIAHDVFGRSVALSGAMAAIGADDTSVHQNGKLSSVYVFSNSGGTWTQTRKLTGSDEELADEFGDSVALDGTTVLSGAFGAHGGPTNGPGGAYFYGGANLGLAISAPGSVGQGEQYTSQAIATNSSSASSPAVAVTVAVPAAASFVSASASQGSCSQDSGVVTCAFGPIAGNGGTATANVTLKATGSAGDAIENTASVAQATPPLTASAPTAIASCAAGYTEHDGTLAAGAHAIEPGGHSYTAPAGQENGVLSGPQGFSLYVVYQGVGGRHVYRAPGNALHHYGPAGEYAWVVKAGANGGDYSFCLKHP